MKSFLILLVIIICQNLVAQNNTVAAYIKANYDKKIYQIPMRDGVRLHTIVYSPKDSSKTYPFLMQRTCSALVPTKKINSDVLLALLNTS